MKLRWLPFAALLGFATCLGAAVALYEHWFHTPLPLRQPVVIDIPAGQPLHVIARNLHDQGILAQAWDLTLFARLRGESAAIKAGEYRVMPGDTAASLLERLVNGKVIAHTLTIVEGWTFAQMYAAVESDPYIKHRLAGLDPKTVMTRLGHPGRAAEGMFFPDTYRFPRGTTDVELYQRAYAAMEEHLKEAWTNRQSGLPFKRPYEGLVLASIVEKETAMETERPMIAGVFVRRLEKGMRLQTDPTVIYGLGKAYNGNITFEDLRRDTPYNTYTRHGLPPTPICLPGLASIQAALHPAAGNALYFVAKGDGTHHFSATLSEHDRAVRKYQLHEADGSGGPKQ